MKYTFLSILFLFSLLIVDAQQDDKFVEHLDSIFLHSQTSKQMMHAYHCNTFLQKQLQKPVSLSDVIRNNTGIFIREYGRGMLSGISIRGTSPSHTQVLWNGISINSPMNGQTDLNTIYTAGFDKIMLKKGGSSNLFGSGGIGGVISLENQIVYQPALEIKNNLNLGSFSTAENMASIKYGTQNIFINFAYNTRKSKNNYPFIGKNINNENAAYMGNDVSASCGYKINAKNNIYFKSQFNQLNREMSGTVYAPSHSKLFTENFRNLLGWKKHFMHFIIQSDFAYLSEKFDYYSNKNRSAYTQNNSRTLVAKSNLIYDVSSNKKLLGGFSYKNILARGDNINRHKRNDYSSYLVWMHRIKHFTYNLSLRKDFSNLYKIPVIGALEMSYVFHKKYKSRISFSKNYNTPTFNDLYWNPNGNSKLKPEESFSAEIGEDIHLKKLEINLGGFYINSRNLIKWTPDNNQIWSPKNFEQVISKGIEFSFNYKTNINRNFGINFYTDYTYQNVTDQKTQKKIIYTPSNTLFSSLSLTYKKIGMKYGLQFFDKIYTTASNTIFIRSHHVHNIGLSYEFSSIINAEINVNNLFNRFYQLVPSRPQPGRNYNLNINFKLNRNEKK